MRKRHLDSVEIRVLACLTVFVVSGACSFGSTVVTYPFPEGLKAADDYQVQVNGKDVYVYYNPVAAIAAFDFEGEVEVVVKPKLDVKWVDIRPKSLNISPCLKDNTISFKLYKPCNLSIELNGEILRHPLFLFANPLEKNAPRPGTEGVRYFEGGKIHEAGVIELKSNETIYIAGGAVVKGLINAQRAENAKIRGRGILDGTDINKLRGAMRYRFVNLEQCKNIEIEGIILSNSTTWQIVPRNCDNVTISNVKIVSDNGGDDGIDIVSSRNVSIDGCFIHTKDDCIVIKSWGGRAKYPSEKVPPGPDVKNILVKNCVLWNSAWGNAIEIGFELRSNFISDVTFKDCDVIHCEDGATFSIHNGDFATVKNIRFEDIRVEDSRQKLIDLAIFRSRYSVDRAQGWEAEYLHGAWDGVLRVEQSEKPRHAGHRGHIRDIYFKDIQVVDGLFPFSIFYGFDEQHIVENVTIEGLWVHGRKITNATDGKFYIENAKNIRFVK